MTTAIVPSVTVDPEAAAYADQIGMRAAFDHMVEVTPRLYPMARSIHVMLRPDFQYPQMNITWWIVVNFAAKGDGLRAYKEWEKEFTLVAPPPREHLFYLSVHGDPT
jgi:hypothetical protein